MKMPGAPAHIEAMLLGWRFSHAVVYVGRGQLVEAWFDCVRERTVAEYPAQDFSWFGVRSTPDGGQVLQSRRDRVAGYAISRLGQPYDYPAWPAVLIGNYWGIDLSGLYVFDPLASCSGLVARAYQAAGLNLINKQVLNLVTPEDLNPRVLADAGPIAFAFPVSHSPPACRTSSLATTAAAAARLSERDGLS